MYATPPRTLGLSPSFGFGDRLGLATLGHSRAMRRAGGSIKPIFAQQSIREMERTGRMPEDVMRDALAALADADWTDEHGADADHLKTADDLERTAEAGFTWFTLDPSDHVDQHADDYDQAELVERFDALEQPPNWVEAYREKSIDLPSGSVIRLDDVTLWRAAVKYGRAIDEAIRLARRLASVQDAAGRDYEIELSVDETRQPTSLAEHFIVAEQCLLADIKLVALAPRLPGELEKGVDYIGDLVKLESSLRDHAAIAQMLGPYKLSLHSGSDKLSIYPLLARTTEGAFHVKTAGTSYLEALRTVARADGQLFREVCEFARQRYEIDQATYHVHATLKGVPAPSELPGVEALEGAYLGCPDDVPPGRGYTAPGRQILHCTFGSVLTDGRLGSLVRSCLRSHRETYAELLEHHFIGHLEALV